MIFLLVIIVSEGGGGGASKKNKKDWKFHIYKGTNLDYDMLCESVNSYQEEKEGDLPNGNCIIILNNLITNMDTILACRGCSQGRDLQI